MEKYKLSLSFPSVLDFVPAVRSLISETLEHFEYNEKEAFRTELIVDELCNNAIIYGSSNSTDNVNIKLIFNEQGYEITVEDKGKNLVHKDRLKHFYDTINSEIGKEIETKGLSLVKLLADDVNIRSSQNGETQIHAIKFSDKEKKDNVDEV